MGVVEDYRIVLRFGESRKLRDKCFSMFSENNSDDVTENDWYRLIRLCPVEFDFVKFRNNFSEYKKGNISKKDFYFQMKSTCDEITKRIDLEHTSAIDAYCRFSKSYHAFFEKKASTASDKNIKLLCEALSNHQVQKIFMEFLGQ